MKTPVTLSRTNVEKSAKLFEKSITNDYVVTIHDNNNSAATLIRKMTWLSQRKSC